MKQLQIGSIIKQRRIELGLTQEELCEGICSPPTICRIEKGKQTPSISKLNALLSRLGLPNEKYYAVMSSEDVQIEELKLKITSCNMRRDFKEGLSYLAHLQKLAEKDDILTQQFILRSKAILGTFENNVYVPYPLEQKLQLLFHALQLTIPNFDPGDILLYRYTLDELKIINQIGVAYGDHGYLQEATDIFYQLIKYFKRKCPISNEFIPTIILIHYNYANYLLEMNRYIESYDIAYTAWDYSIQWGRATYLGSILYILAETSYHLKEIDKSKQFYIQSYYVFQSMKNQHDADIIKENIYEYFQINL